MIVMVGFLCLDEEYEDDDSRVFREIKDDESDNEDDDDC